MIIAEMDDKFIPDDSNEIGKSAANIAAEALEALGREMIRQKTRDIAQQVQIFLRSHPPNDLETLMKDRQLAAIAVQSFGKEGYSAMHDTRGINLFHSNPQLIGQNLHELRTSFPQFWRIIEKSFTQEVEGYYDWPDPLKGSRRKYMVCYPIFPPTLHPIGLVVVVTTFIDEFLEPSRQIRERILTLTERVDQHNRAQQRLNVYLRAINQISSRLNALHSLDVNQIVNYMANAMLKTFGYDGVCIYLGNGERRRLKRRTFCGKESDPRQDLVETDEVDQTVEWVASSGKPYFFKTASSNGSGIEASPSADSVGRIILPIQIGSHLFGVLDIRRQAPPLDETDLFTAQTLAEQLAIALDNARLSLEIRDLAVVEERNRIAREIHDTLAQGFAGISMNIEIAKIALQEQDYAELARIMEKTRGLALLNLAAARRSVQSLRPQIEEIDSLSVVLKQEAEAVAEEIKIVSDFTVIGEEKTLPADLKLGVLRICQEALTNIKKHAHASAINLTLKFQENCLEMELCDNGVGFNDTIASHSEGFGIICMRERARLMGGNLSYASEKGKGTRISLSVPL
ncbi:MAG: hypothetical protein Kow0088_17800 [Anaerolineales bacterium]